MRHKNRIQKLINNKNTAEYSIDCIQLYFFIRYSIIKKQLIYQYKTPNLYKKGCDFIATAPCKNCKQRKIGCHITCKAYLNYKDIKETEKQIILNKTILDMICLKHNIRGINRYYHH